MHVCSVVQSCSTLCDPMDYNLPGSSVHGNFQAIILKWVAISYSRGSSQPKNWSCISCISCIGMWILCHVHHLGSPNVILISCLSQMRNPRIIPCRIHGVPTSSTDLEPLMTGFLRPASFMWSPEELLPRISITSCEVGYMKPKDHMRQSIGVQTKIY